jgi:hypothetical protein
MFALVILLLVVQPGNIQHPLGIKYGVEMYSTEAECEQMRVTRLTSIPKELQVTAVRTACVQMLPAQKGA